MVYRKSRDTGAPWGRSILRARHTLMLSQKTRKLQDLRLTAYNPEFLGCTPIVRNYNDRESENERLARVLSRPQAPGWGQF